MPIFLTLFQTDIIFSLKKEIESFFFMQSGSSNNNLKIVIIGNCAVGKSTILQRFKKEEYKNILPTSTSAYEIIHHIVNNVPIDLHFHDTAGQEKYRSITTQYFRCVDVFVIVYDINDMASFKAVDEWNNLIKEHNTSSNPKIILVGNKCDLSRVISRRNGELKAIELNAEFMEVSAKLNTNIDDLLILIAEQYDENMINNAVTSIDLNSNDDSGHRSNCC